MAGRMTLLANIPLCINGGIETPGRRRGLASKKWLWRKKKVIWYTWQRRLFRSRTVLVLSPVSLWFPIALLSLEWLPLGWAAQEPMEGADKTWLCPCSFAQNNGFGQQTTPFALHKLFVKNLCSSLVSILSCKGVASLWTLPVLA